MAPIGNRHRSSVNWSAHLMREAIGRRAMVQVQAPIQLDDFTMPEPDMAVIRRRSINDLAPVLPSDVYLLVEVADSSLEFDLGRSWPGTLPPAFPKCGLPICAPGSWWSTPSRKGPLTHTCALSRWMAR